VLRRCERSFVTSLGNAAKACQLSHSAHLKVLCNMDLSFEIYLPTLQARRFEANRQTACIPSRMHPFTHASLHACIPSRAYTEPSCVVNCGVIACRPAASTLVELTVWCATMVALSLRLCMRSSHRHPAVAIVAFGSLMPTLYESRAGRWLWLTGYERL
jgi:hypothetical protein